ncbi:hypothetical protein AXF42_Ash019223 [Apostasia shenzhenica]|uniref:Uncharacterized protein n=1 Tax=Apostasia shenzhenica TaxID=1088818 RepID=A0A2I0A2Y7_9ASPA|nr:hypothetical protein AXF42_Ash019223 [Apostasia shenzhenica]
MRQDGELPGWFGKWESWGEEDLWRRRIVEQKSKRLCGRYYRWSERRCRIRLGSPTVLLLSDAMATGGEVDRSVDQWCQHREGVAKL